MARLLSPSQKVSLSPWKSRGLEPSFAPESPYSYIAQHMCKKPHRRHLRVMARRALPPCCCHLRTDVPGTRSPWMPLVAAMTRRRASRETKGSSTSPYARDACMSTVRRTHSRAAFLESQPGSPRGQMRSHPASFARARPCAHEGSALPARPAWSGSAGLSSRHQLGPRPSEMAMHEHALGHFCVARRRQPGKRDGTQPGEGGERRETANLFFVPNIVASERQPATVAAVSRRAIGPSRG